MKFQNALPEDVERIYLLEKLCFGEDGFSKRQLRYLIVKSKGEVICLKKSTEILASMILLYRKGSRHIRIYSIGVIPKMRGKGLAGKLISFAEYKAFNLNLDQIRLEVNENNIPAITLYKSTGFIVSGSKKNYYKDGSNALVMYKNLCI